MSDLGEFTYLKLLSQEVQDMIWSFSFWPQMITLRIVQNTAIIRGSDRLQIASKYSIEISEKSLPMSTTTTWFDPVNTQAPAAFAICQASRAIALSRGYKT